MTSVSYEDLRASLVANGQLFEDDEFPATEESLGFGRDDFRWMRPQEICELIDPSLKPEFFVDGRSRCDVRQGKLIENCWVVAAAACLSTARQDVFDRVVPPDQSFEPGLYCGAFHFNFWYFGEWKNVIVDDRLPTIDGKLTFIHSLSPNEFWGALLEKAYAKLNGSYKLLENGHSADALVDFTGGLMGHHVLESNESECCSSVCGLLKNAFQTQSMATVATEGEKKEVLENGLISNHAYSMIDIKDINVADDTIVTCRLVNPWGEGTIWKGDCVDGTLTEKDKVIHELNTGCESSGEFWIEICDIVNNFHQLEVCYSHIIDDSVWQQQIVYGSWVPGENSGGDKYEAEFSKNPQLIVEVKGSEIDEAKSVATVIVELTQIGRRREGLENLKISFYTYDISSTETPLTGDFIDGTEHLSDTENQLDVLLDCRCVTKRYEISSDVKLGIILATSQPGDSGKFMVRIICDVPSSVISKHYFGDSDG